MNRGTLSLLEVIDVASGVASALVTAHESWLVHTDIRPETIAIRNDGIVQLMAFTMSTWEDPIRRSTALHYISPEQVRGDQIVDSRADIYSLGVVMYEMLAGRAPFDGDAIDILAQIVERDPAPLPAHVPPRLADLVMASLRKNLYERPQTASDVLTTLLEARIDELICAHIA